MDEKQKSDYEEIKKKTLERLRSGNSLFGKEGKVDLPGNPEHPEEMNTAIAELGLDSLSIVD